MANPKTKIDEDQRGGKNTEATIKTRSSLRKALVKLIYYRRLSDTLPPPKTTNVETIAKEGRKNYVASINFASVFTDRLGHISYISKNRIINSVSQDTHTLLYSPQNQEYLKKNRKITHSLASPPTDLSRVTVNSFVSGATGPKRVRRRVESPVMSIYSGGGTVQYYPWMVDCLPRIQLLEDAGYKLEDFSVWGPSRNIPFHRETMAALGVPDIRFLDPDEYQHFFAPICVATSHPYLGSRAHPDPWIIEFLRDRFMSLADLVKFPETPDCVFLSRRDAPSRALVDEDQLFESLAPLGFQRFNLSELSIGQQILLFRNARVIVGTHGAAFTNLCFECQKPTVVEIAQDRHRPDMYENICRHRGLEHHIVYAERVSNEKEERFSNIHLGKYGISRILDIVSKRIS